MLIDTATNHRASVDQDLQDAVSESANQPGTISMSAEAGHGAVPTLDGRALVGLVPDLADLADAL